MPKNKKPNRQRKDRGWGERQQARNPLAATLTFDRRSGKWVETVKP
jgi:hypothetical protein